MPEPDMIGITVKDMRAALRFYRSLGLQIPEGVEGEPHVEVKTPNGYRIAWDTEEMIRDLYPEWIAPRGQRITIAFLCESPGEVDRVFHRLVSEGSPAVREPWDAFWGQRYAVVSDPDGNSVDLFAPLEATES
jgi:catechol 2,3-dioxygenase-like lactoylglutathione lyase family enzyme